MRKRAYPAAVFLAAFLLFLVQPLLAKSMLPMFGGVPGVWATALVFYQALLLAGYAYAHWCSTLPRGRQLRVHIIVMLLSLAWMPVAPHGLAGLDTAPALHVLALLAVSVAGPCLILASSSPLLQSWYGRETRERSAYRLYAVSNAGSLLGLLAYPVVIEPLMHARTQSLLWSALYAVLVLLVGWIGVGSSRASNMDELHAGADADALAYRPHTGARVAWFAYPLCGAALLVAVTNSISMDLATVPFLWVLPLAIYLITYILAFAGWYHRYTFGTLLFVAIGLAAAVITRGPGTPVVTQIGITLLALFSGCMVMHGELARRAPPSAFLTQFYLVTAAGGVTGGAIVALGAPMVLNDYYELPIFLVIALALFAATLYTDVSSRMYHGARPLRWVGLIALFPLAALAFIAPNAMRHAGTIASQRNFYGVLRVIDDPRTKPGAERRLIHGGILHGAQSFDPARRNIASTYYGPGSGVELAFRAAHARPHSAPLYVAVVGLGAGTVAALAAPQDSVRFFEIDPDVERFARRYFTFMNNAAATVVIGDGRLSLEREQREQHGPRYDIIILDAFSGDAVPVHMLTREAMQLYTRLLKPNGIIAFNGTNRHVDFAPVIRGLALTGGMSDVRIVHGADEATGGTPSVWYILTTDSSVTNALSSQPGATRAGSSDRTIVWTDDFSNLLRILR